MFEVLNIWMFECLCPWIVGQTQNYIIRMTGLVLQKCFDYFILLAKQEGDQQCKSINTQAR
jgi:hypothetical protein